MSRSMLRACAVAASLALSAEAQAIMRGDSPLSANDPIVQELVAMKQQIESGDAAATLPRLEALAREQPGAADIWNIYGFALRHAGHRAESHRAYERALAIEPDHLGAHEYLGELFLVEGDPAGAERLLRRLVELCPLDCEERRDLAAAIAAYRAAH